MRDNDDPRHQTLVAVGWLGAFLAPLIILLIVLAFAPGNNLDTLSQDATAALNENHPPTSLAQARADVVGALTEQQLDVPSPHYPYVVASTASNEIYSFTIASYDQPRRDCIQYVSSTQRWVARSGDC